MQLLLNSDNNKRENELQIKTKTFEKKKNNFIIECRLVLFSFYSCSSFRNYIYPIQELEFSRKIAPGHNFNLYGMAW